jgi:hypothetical protein
VGCDGGIYESHDRAANWHHKSNLPVTQFYDVTCDESGPFYSVYGGTQDNFTLGGPARTRSQHGITNADWFVVQGGDGFHCKVDPSDPNTVYGVLQYGVICRYDRRTGQRVQIQPMPAPARRRRGGTGTARSRSARTTPSASTSPRTSFIAVMIAAARGPRSAAT